MKPNTQRKASNIVNALLYSTESITALLFSIVSIALIARHFGPEALSRFSVAQSVSTIFVVVATLGLEQFVIRDLTRNIDDSEYISSIIFGMLGGWLLYIALVAGYYILFDIFSRDVLLIVSVVLTTLFLKVIFIKSHLQAQNKPKPIAISSLVSRLLSIAYLLTGTHFDFSFEVMMLYMPLQAFVLISLMSASNPDFIKRIHFKHFRMGRLIISVREASPLLAATTLYYFYSQSDILIMSWILDPREVGMYSASIRLIPQAAFIGYVVVATFYTQMDKKLHEDRAAFDVYVRSLLTIQFGIGIVMAAIVSLSANQIIQLLYGSRYTKSGEVLAIACWAWVFMLPAALYSRLLIMLGYVKYELLKMLIVAPAVLILHYCAISQVGILGSATVFVFAYFLVDFLVYFIFKDTRHLGIMGINALIDVFTKPRQTVRVAVGLLKARN